ncbi:MAG TPA: winged helix-turn-helix domain-containing protein [Euzebya sp.]|nr:winged helix-turn-helix domain-containing protein [Euzebya sp.]
MIITSAYQEYAALGRMDRAGAQLLLRIAGNVARSGLPTMDGGGWEDPAPHDLAADFVARETFGAELHTIFTRSDDDDRFAAQLYGAMYRFHLTRLRGTEAGRLYRRVDRLLADEPGLHLVDTAAGRAIAADELAGRAPYAGPDEDLYAAARTVDVRWKRWRPSSKRQEPGVTDASLTDIIRTVLAAAGGPVLHTTLHRVLKAVFGLYDPSSVALSDEPAPAGPDDLAIRDQTARRVWLQLSEEERLLLANPGTYRQIADRLGIGKSTAERRVKHLAATLDRMIGLGEDSVPVVERLHDIAQSILRRDRP